jgi:hypothetical protein
MFQTVGAADYMKLETSDEALTAVKWNWHHV